MLEVEKVMMEIKKNEILMAIYQSEGYEEVKKEYRKRLEGKGQIDSMIIEKDEENLEKESPEDA